jgi:hypothetical protein
MLGRRSTPSRRAAVARRSPAREPTPTMAGIVAVEPVQLAVSPVVQDERRACAIASSQARRLALVPRADERRAVWSCELPSLHSVELCRSQIDPHELDHARGAAPLQISWFGICVVCGVVEGPSPVGDLSTSPLDSADRRAT